MKKIIILLIIILIPILVLAATDVKNDASLSTSLDHYWELEETSGNRVDSHGSLTLTEVNGVSSVTGIQGNAATFDGSADGFDFDDTGFPTAAPRSFSAWIKTGNTTSNLMAVFGYGTNASTNHWLPMIGNSSAPDQGKVAISNYGSNITSDTTINDDNWHHVVWVNTTGNTHIFYVDGSSTGQSGSATFSTSLGSGSLGHDLGSGSKFDGEIDEAAFWSKALSADDVTALYNSGSGIPYDAGGGRRRIINF